MRRSSGGCSAGSDELSIDVGQEVCTVQGKAPIEGSFCTEHRVGHSHLWLARARLVT